MVDALAGFGDESRRGREVVLQVRVGGFEKKYVCVAPEPAQAFWPWVRIQAG